ncbi:MAG: hypothetical protein LBU60_02760 [Clostridiales bacterium]|jgi:hypothetical protein|nr:hypothetical protein [Clostridiales bacterium]
MICQVPECIDVSYFTMKNTDLKKKLKEIIPNSTASQTVNSEMRQAIYNRLLLDNPNSQLIEREIDTKSIFGEKDVYSNLEKQLPDYYLFKADREKPIRNMTVVV